MTGFEVVTDSRLKWKWWIFRAIGVFFVGVLALGLWSMVVSQFVTTTLGVTVALVAAAGIGAFGAITQYIDPYFDFELYKETARLRHNFYIESRVTRSLLFGGFMALMGFEAINGAALEFWTLATGKPGQVTMHVGAYRSSSRGNCSGFDLQEAPLTFRRVVCADYCYGLEPPPGTPVVLHGKVSPFGIEVYSHQINWWNGASLVSDDSRCPRLD